MGVQGGEIRIVDFVAALIDLHGKVEHGFLARGDVGRAVIDGQLVGNQGVFFVNPQDRPVGDHAVQTLIDAAGGGDDHFALAFGQIAFFFGHEGIVVGKKCPPFRRAAGQAEENIGNETGFFLYFQNTRADVFRQIFQGRKRVAGGAERSRCGHGG